MGDKLTSNERSLSGATCIIIFNTIGKILAVTRRNTDIWCLPGGKVDEGETYMQAVARELKEETGFEIDLNKIIPVYSTIVFGEDKKDYYCVAYAYLQKEFTSIRSELSEARGGDTSWTVEDGIKCQFIDVDTLLTDGAFSDYNRHAVSNAATILSHTYTKIDV